MAGEKRSRKPKQAAGKNADKNAKDHAGNGTDYYKLFKSAVIYISIAFALVNAFLVYYNKNKSATTVMQQVDPDAAEDANKFQVVDLPGKGKGMIAIRDIAQGELIIREKPLFLVPPSIETSPTELIGGIVRELSETQRYAFWNLSHIPLPKEVDREGNPDRVALAIFETNAVAAGQHVGLFPRMARLNHGCSSAFNVVYTWRDREGVLVVHALKPIKRGEEILTTYINTRQRRHDRRAILGPRYGFECTCKVCALNDDRSRESDDRLVAISDEYSRFATWANQQITGAQAIESVRKIWAIEDEEGYWSERGQLAADAAWVAAAHSDEQATIEWTKLAIQWYSYELGADSDQTHDAKRKLANPRLYRSWGTREKRRVGGPEGR